MTSPLSRPEKGTKFVLFGPQILAFEEHATQLRSTLSNNPKFGWIRDTIATLSDDWDTIAKEIPRLKDFTARPLLEDLNEWLRTGEFRETSFPLPNTLLTPLVVITHLTQYSKFLESVHSGSRSHDDLHASFMQDAETLGLCTGLLSAAAVSSAADQTQLQHYGAVAIRLAMLIGALVDAQDASAGGSRSFSVAWKSDRAGSELEGVLKNIPEAYISVLFDNKRATVTTSTATASSLQQHLKSIGVIIADVSLRGRFHSNLYLEDEEILTKFCDSHSEFQFLDASELALPTRSNTNGELVTNGKLHQIVLRSMLIDQSNWYQAFSALQSSALTSSDSLVIYFGPERCVPSTLVRQIGQRFVQVADLNLDASQVSENLLGLKSPVDKIPSCTDNAIAVVGMSCQLPGATDLGEFWELLCAGKSQHVEVTGDRFGFESFWREPDPKRKWFGNFIKDFDTFDHKFFKKSPREMSSTDPQHRLILQAAYQAVEQSGYFGASSKQDKHIGVYIGVGLVDYENNIACHPANAYSATGNLKSFAAGKISHYFGWTGPGLTIDTACSSSAVAVHTACKAILSGECSGALAGGVNIMTSPEWFLNLAGASFLSPTGQCKPFDINADGYCRGEGVGAVFLKKMSNAIADGDQIFGVISGSAVYQNENCTPITVPNAPSLSGLFSDATRQAGLEPKQISVVEAHGTGTPVGDPAEYDSIRRVFGGSNRSDTLSLGSVKGLVGHTESASGIIALLKTLLMVHKGAIPPQASFGKINPAIGASASDKIEIATSVKPWNIDFRAALINNYGASGSNATLVVTQAPQPKPDASRDAPTQGQGVKYPFWFAGFDEQSLRAYSTKLLKFLRSKNSTSELSISNVAFQVARQSNRSLGQALIFNSGSIQELEEKLSEFEGGSKNLPIVVRQSSRPVIMCFGGQVSKFVGLDNNIYESVKILRSHLDQCNLVCQSLGAEGFYPEIFQRSAIDDIVKLQTSLFAIQYSCAKSWIDCGVEVAAVVGHSFGELTALCISGVLSLSDALKMIVGRARIIQACWGTEKGAMMAVEAELERVEKMLVESGKSCPDEPTPTVACYNGPRSFTVAGSAKAIDAAVELASKNSAVFSMKSKKLNVTNAFHSTLVEPLMDKLYQLGKGLIFREPTIPIERATESEWTGKLTTRFVADHMRKPVFFNQAIQRLSERFPTCVWLEAGSNSGITNMVNRALGSPSTSHFQPINITTDTSFRFLAEATSNLWKEGLNNSFWPHSPSQTSEYSPLILPPYQFEKSKHWMDLKKPQTPIAEPTPPQVQVIELPNGLWTFVGYQDAQNRSVRFRVNTMIEKFSDFILGHIIAETAPLCPSTLQLDIAIDALMSLRPDFGDSSHQPQLQGMDSHAPMSLDPTKFVWLEAESTDPDYLAWDWKMSSTSAQSGSASTLHVSGRIVFKAVIDPQYLGDFTKYERLVQRQRCLSILEGNDVDEVIQGRNIYKTFGGIVEYADVYRGVQKIAGRGTESAGRIVKKYNAETWLDTGLADSFCQIAGIFVNCMTDISAADMYISDRIDQWIRSPKLGVGASRPEVWEVFACHHRPSDKEVTSDVFVFDPRKGALLEVILGIHYIKVSKAGMGKMLARLAPKVGQSEKSPLSAPAKVEVQNKVDLPTPATITQASMSKAPAVKKQSARPDITGPVKDLLCNLSGLEPEEIKSDSDLVEMGIDSLMGMELAREVELAFKCTLETSELVDLTDFQSLIKCIERALGGGDGEEASEVDRMESNEAPEMNGIDLHENGTSSQANGHSSQINGYSNGVNTPPTPSDELSADIVLEAFGESKKATDHFIVENKLGEYCNRVLPRSTELCIAHIADAFDDLGCSIRNAKSGDVLERIKYLPRHEQFVDFVYDLLEKARLIDIDGARVTRTAISVPTKSAETLLNDLIRNSPDHKADHQLTSLIGFKLADCLTGKSDGIQLIFGTPEGKEIASAMYGQSPINVVWIRQIEDFLTRLMSKLPDDRSPIKILEMGAGTGGTTARMIPLLANLGIPVEYTVTDISSSLVAAARKRFKEYPFMHFKVFDIEKGPTPELLHSQHMILATNCVHATHSLATSTKNIHNVLRPDGFLLMLEMTEPLPWVDLIFGLVEGWWLFDDGRHHALAAPGIWERTLQDVGYGHVDWTEGNRPESNVQRLIIALASSPRYDRTPVPPEVQQIQKADFTPRQAVVDAFIQKYTQGFSAPAPSNGVKDLGTIDQCVLLTGATGSLGSHLVQYFSELSNVGTVICLNRHSSIDGGVRQQEALRSRGIVLGSTAASKLMVLETDTAKPRLGLISSDYELLRHSVTHIVHNAWPMSITRPINAFESQFKVMANLIELAREASGNSPKGSKISFQFISSIATVGYYPLWSGEARVPEEQMEVNSVLPTGYGDAKLVCERMLDETLHKYPEYFRPMAVRIGQIAGSKSSGYWNPVEHFAFMVKSSQTLKSLPDFEGELSWCPVNDVAATLGEVLISDSVAYPIYHIENPARQSWREMILVLADALDVPRSNIVPFKDWVNRVRQFPGSLDVDNPASKLVEFLDNNFVRMSCGGLILDTTKSREHSETLRSEAPVSGNLVRKYVRAWKDMGFLHS